MRPAMDLNGMDVTHTLTMTTTTTTTRMTVTVVNTKMQNSVKNMTTMMLMTHYNTDSSHTHCCHSDSVIAKNDSAIAVCVCLSLCVCLCTIV